MKKLRMPKGFSAAGVAAGIKPKKKDMALIVSDVPAVSAGVFTTNQVKAAPVKRDMQVVEKETARAIVINSGIANACTGARGTGDCEAMAALTAGAIGCAAKEVFVCSTGSIGKLLPMEKISGGIEKLADRLASDNGLAVAEAILTTDTTIKTVVRNIQLGGKPVRIVGIAKGSGMIEPNMATMLAFITTDGAIEKHALQHALRLATDTSFNRITVDGDRSTNDTVLCLANGAAGNTPLTQRSREWKKFAQTLEKILFALAMKIVADGEGATRVVTVNVTGAATNGEADEAARAVANSLLNKTAWAGTRPNWGRIMDALGYSYAQVQEEKVDIDYDAVPAVCKGVTADTAPARLTAAVSREAFTININLNLGGGQAVVYTCNCTTDYVRINEE